MRSIRWTWAYWSLFGASLVSVTALSALVLWRLRLAYYADELTRATLTDALVLSLAILACLAVACWAYVSRPRDSPRRTRDPVFD